MPVRPDAAISRGTTPGPPNCRGWVTHTEPELFFPASAAGQAERAKKICAGCPVRRECLQFALATRQSDGVWGGLELTAAERRKPVRA
ncbi:MAG TPA: WhiB family transcriptional regulator [Trebonia sp.]|jgi:WhiB family redox-sensing transcriptional regulator